MRTLVIADHNNNELDTATYRVVTAALKLGNPVDIAVLGNGCALVVDSAAVIEGVERVLLSEAPALEHFLADAHVPVITEISRQYTHVMTSAGTTGKNIMPGVAALLDVSQLSEITDVLDADTFERPVYAGNALMTVRSVDKIKVMTVRASAFDMAPATGDQAEIIKFEAELKEHGTEFVENRFSISDRPALSSARVVVSGGRGLGSKENFAMLEKLADKLGAALGASRAAVDAGYVGNDLQVGQTGKIVAPELYIAVGISGAIQHLAGMKDSKVIVAVNQDADAPIFQAADYGVVADLFTFLPELEAALAS